MRYLIGPDTTQQTDFRRDEAQIGLSDWSPDVLLHVVRLIGGFSSGEARQGALMLMSDRPSVHNLLLHIAV